MKDSTLNHNIKHVAIIMDGNGRWAKQRSRPRVWGHVRGSVVVSDIVEEADNLGVEALTLYAFSTENWSRPQGEIRVLFTLLAKFLQKERAKILKNEVRFKVMGDISNLAESTKKLIYDLEEETQFNKGLKLTFAFGYGGRSELSVAINRFMKDHPGQEVTPEAIEKYLMVPDLGDVDLLIRTGGDQRISNFMLWQIAYAELYFSQTKWPDFTTKEFREIIEQVSSRERRFGSVSELQDLNTSRQLAKKNLEVLGATGV